MNPDITAIQRGIIFVMAEWSGNAVWALKQLSTFLREHGVAPEHLTCIDVDREPEIYKVPELSGKIHGHGEAAVVRHGRIVFTTTLGQDQSKIQERCEELLKAHAG